jgi:hypothetical protein
MSPNLRALLRSPHLHLGVTISYTPRIVVE